MDPRQIELWFFRFGFIVLISNCDVKEKTCVREAIVEQLSQLFRSSIKTKTLAYC